VSERAAAGAPPEAKARPKASLSLDLDNLWSYQKTHGDAGWDRFPTYLDVVVPRILEVCSALDLTITVFVVGQDAADPRNHDALAALAEAGHEIGNHSFRHEPWMHRWSRAATDDELARTEEAIEAVTGTRPTGFRGPGYALSETTLDVLVERGYAYDASTLPTWIGPLARAYYFRSAKLSPEQRAERAGLFGHVADARRRLRPYRWDLGDGRRLLELPVTVLPFGRVPVHPSYLLYLAGVRPALARAYLAGALRTCRLAKVEPSILLHPLDLLGGDDLAGHGRQEGADLSFFPAMDQRGSEKVAMITGFLEQVLGQHDVLTMAEHVADLERRGGLADVAPRFRDEEALDVELLGEPS
jgi:peptidoglycan/xylan/chitin deacetylase (PgdA/CDA1 family)